jgi:hypothetical protein
LPFSQDFVEIKIIIVSLCPVLAIISQARISIEYAVASFLSCFAVALALGLIYLLFLPNIRKLTKRAAVAANIVYLPSEQFSEKDLRCLKKVQDGEKYESIAKDEDIGLSTLKNRLKALYQNLDVYDKTSFMSTYAGYTILIKPMPKDYSE